MPQLALSVIIPAYDEALRLPPYLDSIHSYLDGTFRQPYEVIVVDDGSADETARTVETRTAAWPELRLIQHAKNQGKGAAVRTGVLAGQGERILFTDADGATPIEEYDRLAAAIDAGADVAIGSRLLRDPSVKRSRDWYRGLAGRLFAAMARHLLDIAVFDTQCGFKVFRSAAAQKLFASLQEARFLFDLELLVLANHFELRVVEVPIRWRDVPGGHLHPLRKLPRIFTGLRRIRSRLRDRQSR